MPKNLFFLLLSMLFTYSLKAQVPKELVLVEKFSGTWCAACPLAVRHVHSLIDEEDANIAVISYQISDNYEISGNSTRNDYYNVFGYPTVFFDGILNPLPYYEYDLYIDYYEERRAQMSNYDISELDIVQNGENAFDLSIAIQQVAGESIPNLRLMVLVTETHIEDYWFSEPQLLDVVRRYLTSSNGNELILNADESFSDVFSFSLDNSWNRDYCKAIAFIQNIDTKEVYQAKEITLADQGQINDVVIEKIQSVDQNCNGNYVPQVQFRNSGTDILTSVDFEYSMNGGEPQTYNWTGNVDFLEQTIVELPSINFEVNETNILNIELKNPNGTLDEITEDNGIEFPINESLKIPTQTLYLDYNTYQTGVADYSGWQLLDENGVEIASSYYDLDWDHNVLHEESFELEESKCYDFFAYDVNGDGLAYDGYFRIRDEAGNVYIQNNGPYKEKHHPFRIEGTVSSVNEYELINSEISPNPSNGLVNIKLKDAKASVVLYNALGIEIKHYSFNENNFVLDLSNHNSGLYFIKINKDIHKLILR